MRPSLLLLILTFSITCSSQSLNPKELLEKTIKYHDPAGNWKTFSDTFTVVMNTPDAAKRISTISISLPAEYFSVKAIKGTEVKTYTLDKDKCEIRYADILLDSLEAKEKNMDCDRAILYKNYYTYLYGLPMKLNDPGTNLDKTVLKKKFKGKDYLVLKVNYDGTVGSDVWYFYINPITYAMELYQFFKTDETGIIKPNSGEYILLSEETIINGIKMPKVRAWYYNKDDKYLGTDSLELKS